MVQSLEMVPGEEGFVMLSYSACSTEISFVTNYWNFFHSVSAPPSLAGRLNGKLLHITDQRASWRNVMDPVSYGQPICSV